jgi:hypothetical protein
VPSHHAQPTVMTSAKSAPNLLQERQHNSAQNSPKMLRTQQNIIKEDHNSEDDDEQETMLLQSNAANLSLRDSKKTLPKEKVRRKSAIKELLSNTKLLNTSDTEIQNSSSIVSNDEMLTDVIPYTGVSVYCFVLMLLHLLRIIYSVCLVVRCVWNMNVMDE